MAWAASASSSPSVVSRRVAASPYVTEMAGRSSSVTAMRRPRSDPSSGNVTFPALAVERLLEHPQHVELDRRLLLGHVAAVAAHHQRHEIQALREYAQLGRAIEPIGVLAEDPRLVE